MAEQYPTNTLAVGGQGTLAGWDVLEDQKSFAEAANSYRNANGTHKVDIVYSRRQRRVLTLQAQYGTSPATLLAGGSLTYDSVSWRIESFDPRHTHEPITATLTLIAVADSIS